MTLAQAIEKVGVGGKLHHILYGQYRVTAIGELNVLLINNDGIEQSWQLTAEGWSPVLPKRRVVLQAWRNMTTGFTVFLGEGETFNSKHGYVRRQDIPDMITEDGKWVFER